MTNKFDEITLAAGSAATASYCPPESDVCDGDSCDSCEGMASAVLMNCTGTTVYGNIAYRLQDVWYKFNTPAAGTYRIESSGNIDTVGYLYDSNGALLYTDHDSGSGNNFLMDASLGRDETFYIRITTYGTTIGTFGITVTPFVSVSSITLNKTTLNMLPNQSEYLVATVNPGNATVKDVQWFSNVPEVAEVNGGWICSNEEGTATIYARAKDGSGIQASCTVTVATKKVTSITLDQTSLELNPGESKRIIATPLPQNAHNKNLYWFSTCPEVADVTDGWVCAISPGETQIYACATDGSGIQAICSVTISRILVSSVVITPQTVSITVGDTKKLNYSVYPSNATNQDVIWSSSDPDIVSVQAATGEITANKPGNAIITARAYEGPGYDCCCVTVNKKVAIITQGAYSNKIVFTDSGKEWQCLNADMIYTTENQTFDVYNAISNMNFYKYPDNLGYDQSTKTYDEDEYKLIYAIDPHGWADYVYRMGVKKEEQEGLEKSLEFKNTVFENLFGRASKRCFVDTNGILHTALEHMTLDEVIYESETIFGPRNDNSSIDLSFVLDIAEFILGFYLPVRVKTYYNIAKLVLGFLFLGEGNLKDMLSAQIEEAIDNTLDQIIEDWAEELVKRIDKFETLQIVLETGVAIAAMNEHPEAYRKSFEYCMDQTIYDVYIQHKTGSKVHISDLNDLIVTQ